MSVLSAEEAAGAMVTEFYKSGLKSISKNLLHGMYMYLHLNEKTDADFETGILPAFKAKFELVNHWEQRSKI